MNGCSLLACSALLSRLYASDASNLRGASVDSSSNRRAPVQPMAKRLAPGECDLKERGLKGIRLITCEICCGAQCALHAQIDSCSKKLSASTISLATSTWAVTASFSIAITQLSSLHF